MTWLAPLFGSSVFLVADTPEPAAESTAESPRAPKSPALAIFACIVLFCAVIGALATHYLRPRGERVGELDLQKPSPTLALDLPTTRALNFRLDVTVTTKGPQTSSRATRGEIYKSLEASTITVSDTGPAGAALSTTCAAFDGKSTSASSSANEVEVHGIPIVCSLAPLPPGHHTLTGKVVWAKDTDVRTATLEVRSEPSHE